MYGSIFRFEGQASVFWRDRGPCYRCLFPEPPPPGLVPSCAEGGVLGVLPGVIGSIQATEALKILLGVGEPLVGRLLLYDALAMRFDEVELPRDPACPLCSPRRTIVELQDYPAFCGLARRGRAGRGDRGRRAASAVSTRESRSRSSTSASRTSGPICRIEGARLVPLGVARRASPRARPRAHLRPAVPLRRPLGEGAGPPPSGGFRPPPEPARRHPRLGARRRSDASGVLSPAASADSDPLRPSRKACDRPSEALCDLDQVAAGVVEHGGGHRPHGRPAAA